MKLNWYGVIRKKLKVIIVKHTFKIPVEGCEFRCYLWIICDEGNLTVQILISDHLN